MTSTPIAAQSPAHAGLRGTPRPVAESIGRVLPTRPPGLLTMVGMVAPLAAFLLADATWGLVPGIVVSTTTAVVAGLVRMRRGSGVGWLSLALLGYLIARGAAGALTGSHQVFFGISVAASVAVAAAVLVTAFTRVPLAVYALPTLMRGRLRQDTVAHPTYRRISAHVTAVWAIAELAVSGWEAWHLQHADAIEFVGARALIGWPTMAAVVFACAFYARFRIEWLQAHPARRPSSFPSVTAHSI